MTTVLVVDDHPTNRALIVTLVHHRGYAAIEAADGAEALALVAAHRPALVVCDILMPTMDGYEFVRRLRDDPAIAHTKVVFYSAYYRQDDARQLAAQCGVAHVIAKPCEPAEVLRIIDLTLADDQAMNPPAVAPEFNYAHLRVVTDQLAVKAEELQASNDRFAALIDLNLRLASENNPRTLLEHVCRSARELLGATYAVLAVREKDHANDVLTFNSGIAAGVAASLPGPEMQAGRIGEAYAQRVAARFASSAGDAAFWGLPPGYPPARAGLVAPITSPSHAYGWIFLAEKSGAIHFNEEDERLLAILAAQVGRIYENGSLYYRLREQTEQLKVEVAERERTSHALVGMIGRLEALRSLDNQILEANLPSEVAGVALAHLTRLVDAAHASVLMFDTQNDRAVMLARVVAPGMQVSMNQHIPMDDYGRADFAALQRGEIVHRLFAAAQDDPLPFIRKFSAAGVRYYVRIPIKFEGALAGALSMGTTQADHFTPDQIDIAQTIANQLGIALQQATLRQKIEHQAADLEQRVVERTAELAAANEDLEAFSYTVSHDLRAPLRVVDGYSRMLEEDYAGQLDEKGRRFLATIRGNGQRMGELIDDLLRFAQLGRERPRFAAVDMRALAHEAWLESGAPDAVDFTLGDLPQAQGDRALLKQVWSNLMANARKYSGNAARPAVTVSAEQTAEENIFCISDNGAGFDMRYADKLFGVFQRLHSHTEFPGTGVGLAIVHRVVTRHHGRVWAKGEVGNGAQFYFALPRVKADLPEAPG